MQAVSLSYSTKGSMNHVCSTLVMPIRAPRRLASSGSSAAIAQSGSMKRPAFLVKFFQLIQAFLAQIGQFPGAGALRELSRSALEEAEGQFLNPVLNVHGPFDRSLEGIMGLEVADFAWQILFDGPHDAVGQELRLDGRIEIAVEVHGVVVDRHAVFGSSRAPFIQRH